MATGERSLWRKSSIPSYIVSSENAVEIDETDLRWRRSSHAAISSMLPSRNAFHSDTGLTLTRQITDPQRRKSMAQRRKSVAAFGRESVSRRLSEYVSKSSTIRKLLMGLSTVDTWILGYEDREQTVESIRSMTATISVKRMYSFISEEDPKRRFMHYFKRKQAPDIPFASLMTSSSKRIPV